MENFDNKLQKENLNVENNNNKIYSQKEVEEIIKNYLNNNTYQWWIVSDSIIKRSFAILGHYFLGYLMLVIPFIVIIMIFTVIFTFVALK